jgi:hypothetical protein
MSQIKFEKNPHSLPRTAVQLPAEIGRPTKIFADKGRDLLIVAGGKKFYLCDLQGTHRASFNALPMICRDYFIKFRFLL